MHAKVFETLSRREMFVREIGFPPAFSPEPSFYSPFIADIPPGLFAVGSVSLKKRPSGVW